MYKIGDKVRIINAQCIESDQKGEIGTVIKINTSDNPTLVIDMGRRRRPHSRDDGNATCWWLYASDVEHLDTAGNQLLLFGDL